MGLYYVSVDQISLAAATAKSVLEISVPSTTDVRIAEWWIDFDGVTSTAIPVKVEMGRFTSAVTTATSITPAKLNNTAAPASACTVKHSASAEGAGALGDIAISRRISPTTGFHYVAPLGNEMYIAASSFWRMRLTAAAAVNATVGVIWGE